MFNKGIAFYATVNEELTYQNLNDMMILITF